MDEILIRINWVYFLGIIGALIAVAFYTGSRFSKIETDVGWIKKILGGLKIDINNKDIEAFKQNSPAELTEKGKELLEGSGLKKYLDDKEKENIILNCKSKNNINNAYDVQGYVFDLMDNLEFEEDFNKKFKDYSYREGASVELMRRIGGIYLRDICLEEMKLDKGDIDHRENLE